MSETAESMLGIAAWVIAETSHTGITRALALQRLRSGPTDLGLADTVVTAEAVIRLMDHAARFPA